MQYPSYYQLIQHDKTDRRPARMHRALYNLLEVCMDPRIVSHAVLSGDTRGDGLFERISYASLDTHGSYAAFDPDDFASTKKDPDYDPALWQQVVHEFVEKNPRLHNALNANDEVAAMQLMFFGRALYRLADELFDTAQHAMRDHAAALEQLGRQRLAERGELHATLEATHHGQRVADDHAAWVDGSHSGIPQNALRHKTAAHWQSLTPKTRNETKARMGLAPDESAKIISLAEVRDRAAARAARREAALTKAN